jgi:hypothetical protein
MVSSSSTCLVLVGFICSMWMSGSSATNYDAFIHDISRRSQHIHDSFMGSPGVRDHVYQELGGLYNDQGYLNEYPEDNGDPDNQWQRILSTVDKIRVSRKSELQELREKLRNDERFYPSGFGFEEPYDEETDENEEESTVPADQRSAEVPYKNHLNGEQKVSGGSGKSQSVASEVKTDKLPGYCDPPNPCPIGVDPEKLPAPCDMNIPNTKAFNKQWIWKKMESGECSCDTEHMETCPPRQMPHHQMSEEDIEKRNPHLHRSVVKKAGPYRAI